MAGVIVLEYKLYGRAEQFAAVNEAIRTVQFIRNKCLRKWMDEEKVSKYDLSAFTATLAKEYPFAAKLNSMARQAAAERAWSAISRFYENAKKGVRPVGYPTFDKHGRSVEYKTTGWKLSMDRKRLTFTDGHGVGSLKMKGTRDLDAYDPALIKRVRIVRRADGHYAQFALSVQRSEGIEPSGKAVGLDVGLESFYTDSTGHHEPNPRFLRKADRQLRRAQRRVSRRKKGSTNRRQAVSKLGRIHLRVQRQRKDHATKLARCVVRSNDLVAVEDLQVASVVKNRFLARSIADVSWGQFRGALEYFGRVYGKVVVAVPPHFTSVECSSCGARVAKSLSTRTHACPCCKAMLHRDHNAALNVLERGLRIAGHARTAISDDGNAWGEEGRYSPDSNAGAASPLVEPGIPRL